MKPSNFLRLGLYVAALSIGYAERATSEPIVPVLAEGATKQKIGNQTEFLGESPNYSVQQQGHQMTQRSASAPTDASLNRRKIVNTEFKRNYVIRKDASRNGKRLLDIKSATSRIRLTGRLKVAWDGSRWAQVKIGKTIGYVNIYAIASGKKRSQLFAQSKKSVRPAPAPAATPSKPKAPTKNPLDPSEAPLPPERPKIEAQPLAENNATQANGAGAIATSQTKVSRSKLPAKILPSAPPSSAVKTGSAQPSKEGIGNKSDTARKGTSHKDCARNQEEYDRNENLVKALGPDYKPWGLWKDNDLYNDSIVIQGNGQMYYHDRSKNANLQNPYVTLEICIDGKTPYPIFNGQRLKFDDDKGIKPGHLMTLPLAGKELKEAQFELQSSK